MILVLTHMQVQEYTLMQSGNSNNRQAHHQQDLEVVSVNIKDNDVTYETVKSFSVHLPPSTAKDSSAGDSNSSTSGDVDLISQLSQQTTSGDERRKATAAASTAGNSVGSVTTTGDEGYVTGTRKNFPDLDEDYDGQGSVGEGSDLEDER
jgi:hypothetical protein